VQVGQIGITEEEIKPKLLDIKDIEAYEIPYNLCNWYAKKDEKCLNLRSLIESGSIEPEKFNFWFEGILTANAEALKDLGKSFIAFHVETYGEDITVLLITTGVAAVGAAGGCGIAVAYGPEIAAGTTAAATYIAEFLTTHPTFKETIYKLIDTFKTDIAQAALEVLKKMGGKVEEFGAQLKRGVVGSTGISAGILTKLSAGVEKLKVLEKLWPAEDEYLKAWNIFHNYCHEKRWKDGKVRIYSPDKLKRIYVGMSPRPEKVDPETGYGKTTDWCAEVLQELADHFQSHPFGGDFDPEREETWLIEDGHYPSGGDKWLDKQRREEENQATPA
jgi:hypothetical protein